MVNLSETRFGLALVGAVATLGLALWRRRRLAWRAGIVTAIVAAAASGLELYLQFWT